MSKSECEPISRLRTYWLARVPDRWRDMGPNLLCLMILLLILVFYFRPGIWSSGTLLNFGDTWRQFYPFQVEYSETLRQGRIAIWTTSIGNGFPLHAEGQGEFLYPINLLLYSILSPLAAYNGVVILHAWLAGVFMFLFVRNLGTSRAPALLAALVYVLSGPAIRHIGPLANVAIWLPLLLYCVDELTRQGKLLWAAAAGTVISMQILGSSPQMLLFSVVTASLYLLFRLVSLTSRGWGHVARVSILWALALVIGLGLGAGQLLPTYELSQFSARAGVVDATFAGIGSVLPTGLATFIFPHWTFLAGSNTAQPGYVGIITLCLVVEAIYRRRERQTAFFLMLAILFTLFALGDYTPFYEWVRRLPGFNVLRAPSRAIYIVEFALAVMAGLGMDALKLRAPDIRRVGQIAIRALGTILISGLIGLGVGNAILQVGKEPILNFGRAFVRARFYGDAYHVQPWEYFEREIQNYYANALAAINPFELRTMMPFLLALLGLIIFWLWRRRRWQDSTIQILLLVVTTGDLLFFLGGATSATGASDLLTTPPTAAFLQQDSSLFRIYTVFRPAWEPWTSNLLIPDTNMIYHIPSVGIYSPLGIKRLYDLMDDLGLVDLCYGSKLASPDSVKRRLSLLSVMNVKYILSRQPLDDPRLRLAQEGEVAVYENTIVLPRAFLVSRFRVIPDQASALAIMTQNLFDAETEVILEESVAEAAVEPVRRSEKSEGKVTLTQYTAEYVALDVETTTPAFLVLSDTYYPGWQATIDGQPTKIYRANYVMRSIYLPAGRHHIEFRYVPFSYHLGITLSLFAFAVVAGVLVRWIVVEKLQSGRRFRDGDHYPHL